MEGEYQEVQKLVSVIVPIYNVKNYLIQCVDSILNQTYKKIQIILIDDGSTDGSGVLCDTFKDSRITVIHQQNRGLSGARNAGLEAAEGEYILFVDSDDFIRSTMIEDLYAAAENINADFAASAVEYMRCDNGESTYSGNSALITELDYTQSIHYLCKLYLFNVWNKLYRRKLIHDIRYVEGVVCEDVGYMCQVFNRISKTAYVDKPLYVYRLKRPGSSGMTFDARKLPAIEEYEMFIQFLSNKGLKKEVRMVRINQLALIKSLYNETEDSDKESRKKVYELYWRKMVKECAWLEKPISNIGFLLLPGISRSRYQSDKQKI